MSKQAVKQAFENNSMEVALEALAASIARWTEKGDQHRDRDPGPGTLPAGRADPADERHVRAEHLLDRPRGQTRAAGRRHVCV